MEYLLFLCIFNHPVARRVIVTVKRMLLKITDTDFTNAHDWLFKADDKDGNGYYIMNEAFYMGHNRPSPVTKKELDSLDQGEWINARTEIIAGRKIVVRIEK